MVSLDGLEGRSPLVFRTLAPNHPSDEELSPGTSARRNDGTWRGCFQSTKARLGEEKPTFISDCFGSIRFDVNEIFFPSAAKEADTSV
jgi:hypothetical protein